MMLILGVASLKLSLFIVGGLSAFAIGQLWNLVIAAKRGVLWLLAILIFPIINLVLVFVEPRAILAVLLSMGGLGSMWYGLFDYEDEVTRGLKVSEKVRIAFGKTVEEATAGAPSGSDAGGNSEGEALEERKRRIQAWQAELTAKKAGLKPGDAAAQAAFDAELKEYLAELQIVKDEMAKAPGGTKD